MKKYETKDDKCIERGMWVVVFLHSLGWTRSSELFSTRIKALGEAARQKDLTPGFKYRAVRVEISFEVPKK